MTSQRSGGGRGDALGRDSGGPPSPNTVRGRPLAELRKAVADERGLDRLAGWVEALQADGRRGATEIADRLARRCDRIRAEQARVATLFERRQALFARGRRCVAGVDEVGVGPLAGPVVAGAVVLPDKVELPGLDDSKKLSAGARERLDALIRGQAIAVSVSEVSPAEIDRLNILQATLEAMRRAVAGLVEQVPVDHLMVDARTIPGVTIAQTPLIHGDAHDGSIAAASIVAKVYRDALMREFDGVHPGYGLGRHMGYGTAEHLDALRRLGASPIHRRSFAPVAAVLGH